MFNFKTILVDGKEYVLNRENTIFLFRKMWSDFATNPEYEKFEFPKEKEKETNLYRAFLRNEAKAKWLFEHTNLGSDTNPSKANDRDFFISNDCFLCEYDDKIWLTSNASPLPCKFCPIDWNNGDRRCCSGNRSWLTLSFEEIANLPEAPINPKYEIEN